MAHMSEWAAHGQRCSRCSQPATLVIDYKISGHPGRDPFCEEHAAEFRAVYEKHIAELNRCRWQGGRGCHQASTYAHTSRDGLSVGLFCDEHHELDLEANPGNNSRPWHPNGIDAWRAAHPGVR